MDFVNQEKSVDISLEKKLMLYGIVFDVLTSLVSRGVEGIEKAGGGEASGMFGILYIILGLLGIIGVIMHIYGVYKFSIKVNDEKIKNNAIICGVLKVVGLLFIFLGVVGTVLGIIFLPLIICGPGLAILGLILYLISYYFMGEYLLGIYQYTSIKLFEECGKYMKWGVFTYILLIGFLLVGISLLGSIFAFAKLPYTLDIKST
jgi:uncharacterized membrane protein